MGPDMADPAMLQESLEVLEDELRTVHAQVCMRLHSVCKGNVSRDSYASTSAVDQPPLRMPLPPEDWKKPLPTLLTDAVGRSGSHQR